MIEFQENSMYFELKPFPLLDKCYFAIISSQSVSYNKMNILLSSKENLKIFLRERRNIDEL